MTDPALALRKLLAALDASGIRYLIGGSVASSIYSIYRATADVDLVAEMRPESAAELAGRLVP